MRASVKALDRRPCFQCATTMRALPSAIRGPVERPPCSRHRVLPASGGFWHAVPRRVRAPQLWRGRSGPKHGWETLFRLLFAMSKSPPDMSLNMPYFGWLCEAQVPWFAEHDPSKTIQRQLSSSNTTGGTWVRALWSRALVLGSRPTGHGPRQDGAATLGQV